MYHRLGIFIGILWMLSMFSSCGTSSETDTSASEVHARLPTEPDGLNPILLRNSYSRQIAKQLFQPMMEFDPQSLVLKPVLALAPPTSEILQEGPYAGGVAYTFEIRPEAKWDNGSSVLATDYEFTFKTILNPYLSNFFRSYLSFIKAVRIDPENPRKFTVYTDRQYFLAELVCSNIQILPAYFYDPENKLVNYSWEQLTEEAAAERLQGDTTLQQLAETISLSYSAHDPALLSGSGPYRLVEWQPGQSLRLEKKVSWWGDALDEPSLSANVTAIRYSIIPNATAAFSLLKDGSLDVMSGIPPKEFTELQKEDYLSQNYHWFSPPQLSYIYIALNRENPKLEDTRLRKALALTLPTKTILENVLYGMGKETIGPFSPESAIYNSELSPVEENVDSARYYLQQAGWEDSNGNGIVDKVVRGKREEMTLQLDVTAGNDRAQQIGAIFQENARKAGIDIQVQSLDFSKLSDRLRSRNFEMSYSRRIYSPGDPDPSQTWSTGKDHGGKTNYSGFGNAQSDALIDALQESLDKTDRRRIYQELQALIYADQPVLFVAVPQSCIAIHRRFTAQASQIWPGYFPERFQMSTTE